MLSNKSSMLSTIESIVLFFSVLIGITCTGFIVLNESIFILFCFIASVRLLYLKTKTGREVLLKFFGPKNCVGTVILSHLIILFIVPLLTGMGVIIPLEYLFGGLYALTFVCEVDLFLTWDGSTENASYWYQKFYYFLIYLVDHYCSLKEKLQREVDAEKVLKSLIILVGFSVSLGTVEAGFEDIIDLNTDSAALAQSESNVNPSSNMPIVVHRLSFSEVLGTSSSRSVPTESSSLFRTLVRVEGPLDSEYGSGSSVGFESSTSSDSGLSYSELSGGSSHSAFLSRNFDSVNVHGMGSISKHYLEQTVDPTAWCKRMEINKTKMLMVLNYNSEVYERDPLMANVEIAGLNVRPKDSLRHACDYLANFSVDDRVSNLSQSLNKLVEYLQGCSNYASGLRAKLQFMFMRPYWYNSNVQDLYASHSISYDRILDEDLDRFADMIKKLKSRLNEDPSLDVTAQVTCYIEAYNRILTSQDEGYYDLIEKYINNLKH